MHHQANGKCTRSTARKDERLATDHSRDMPDLRVARAHSRRLAWGPVFGKHLRRGPRCQCHPAPIPLEVVRCAPEADKRACGFVQLRHTVPPELIYHSYGYKSGINRTMTCHLHAIARPLETQMELTQDDIAVDIGSNDGTLLAGYTAKGLRRVGFEPSTAANDVASDAYTLIREYFSAATFRRVFPEAKAKVITSVAMFYDLEDPNAFVSDVAAILDTDGCWLLELSYLPLMMERRSFDTICHEHLGYYSLFPLEYLLASHGLQIVDVALNQINGGSLRAWITHRGASTTSIDSRVAKARARFATPRIRARSRYPGALPAVLVGNRWHSKRPAIPDPQLAIQGESHLWIWSFHEGKRHPSILRSRCPNHHRDCRSESHKVGDEDGGNGHSHRV